MTPFETSAEGFNPSTHMRSFVVQNRIPEPLEKLRLLSENLWWNWNPDALSLFSRLDPQLWIKTERNAVAFLHTLSPSILESASRSPEYLRDLNLVFDRFEKHLAQPREAPSVAFFCAEYGISSSLRFYSGGLGILAGDLIKTASDMNLPLCGVGLAYHLGYFQQRISPEGTQENHYMRNDFSTMPMELARDADGQPVTVKVPFPNGAVHVRAWRVAVGNVDLFLLDTDFSANEAQERAITNTLYGGDRNHRLRQELILGIGGHLILRALQITPAIYHMNEGHSAFLVFARLAELIHNKGLEFQEALEYIRHTSVFTTHTPVAAGHDHFSEDLLRTYLGPLTDTLKQEWPAIMDLGLPPADSSGHAQEFSMTHLCLQGSQRVNGVSRIHGRVSREMFTDLFSGLYEEEVPITSITNGIHVPTWLAPEWHEVFSRELGSDWGYRLFDERFWDRIRNLPLDLIKNTHNQVKGRLIGWLKEYVIEAAKNRYEPRQNLEMTLKNLDQDPLIIGFARRFAPYKRAHLLFHDLAKLESILAKSSRPVLFLFSGKAHPADGQGQSLIKHILELSREPALAGRILFIENYEMDVAQLLVSGCDVWLNTPTRPLEASGTSGMKAAINGCLNLSIPDGWWAEGYNGKNGWTISSPSREDKADELPEALQNEYDSARIYDLLDHEVIPKFQNDEWISMMRESIATITPRFSSARMLRDYQEQFYRSSIDDAQTLEANDFEDLRHITAHKTRLMEGWDSISFLDVQMEGIGQEKALVHHPISVQVRLNHPDLAARELLVQAILARPNSKGTLERYKAYPLKMTEDTGPTSAWNTQLTVSESGSYSLGIRIVPYSYYRDHRVELLGQFVKWL